MPSCRLRRLLHVIFKDTLTNVSELPVAPGDDPAAVRSQPSVRPKPVQGCQASTECATGQPEMLYMEWLHGGGLLVAGQSAG